MWSPLYMENTVPSVKVVEPNNFLMWMHVRACVRLTLCVCARVGVSVSIFLYLYECTHLLCAGPSERPFQRLHSSCTFPMYTIVCGHQLCVLFFKWFAKDVCHSYFNQINSAPISYLWNMFIYEVYITYGFHFSPESGTTRQRNLWIKPQLYICVAAIRPLIKAA